MIPLNIYKPLGGYRASPPNRMSGPASLEQLSKIVTGQVTALCKHKQALATLFAKVQWVGENVAHIQSLLQASPTPPSREWAQEPPPKSSQPPMKTETWLPAPQPYAGQPGGCNPFIMQYSLIFKMQPSQCPSEQTKIADMTSLLSDLSICVGHSSLLAQANC